MNKFLKYLLFMVIYIAGYFFLALLSTGGGHGNFYLLTPLIPWLLLIAAVFSLYKFENFIWRIAFLVTMALHYGLLFSALIDYPFNEDRGWTKSYFPFVPVIWYIAGQIIVWFTFLNELIKNQDLNPVIEKPKF